MDSKRKNARTLDMYVRLCEGKSINKKAEAINFGVDERSIQRDIDDIRAFLCDRSESNGMDTREVVYDRTKDGFVMIGDEPSMMTNSEILAVSKILLESRAFTKRELKTILDKLVEGCVPLKNMKLVSDLISNEKYHYVELHHKSITQDKIWELGEDIKNHNLVKIKYMRGYDNKDTVERVVEPVGIIFSEYYFYLNAYIDVKNEAGEYVHKYDYPAIFRIDRIKTFKQMGETFKLPYSSRFEEGEFRKRIQFMYAGKLMNIRLKYYGINPEPVLDRLPTAKIVKEENDCCEITAEVFGNGIVMWLLSQGSKVEVLKPDSLREEMKKQLQEMLGRY